LPFLAFLWIQFSGRVGRGFDEKKIHTMKTTRHLNAGDEHGRLTAVGPSTPFPLWTFQCSCGKLVEKRKYDVLDGKIASCGCLQAELLGAFNKKTKTTHGMRSAPEYEAWRAMKKRCYSNNTENWIHYGGRGITVCERWLNSSEAFLEDMGRRPSSRHSLGRINNDGNYEPSNCRWETPSQQLNNTRTNHTLEFRGEVATIAQWALKIGVPRHLICSRIRYGWSVEKTLTTPNRMQHI